MASVLVLLGVVAADSVVSLLIAALVLVATWGLLRDALRVLMQLPPRGFDVGAVRRILREAPGVEQTFFEIEFPGAILLGQKAALQPVG